MTTPLESSRSRPDPSGSAVSFSPVTQLLQVERDGNPQRRFGHASPFIGKLGPLNADALRRIALLTAASLPDLPGSTLVIGMTESSLLLSWFLATYFDSNVELRFTTRYSRSVLPGREFAEPHSHGPRHFLALEPGSAYHQIVIIEDELTTGATLRNLLLAVRDVASRLYVVTLADQRAAEKRECLQQEMAALGIESTVTDLSAMEASGIHAGFSRERPHPPRNPFGRSQAAIAGALAAARHHWQTVCPDALYIIGECVDIGLTFWESLCPDERPCLRQVTRSPWLVDG
ncbi:MAG TPA: phosphoribosyltransferase domain-containing protein, partial [Blastocatellia bacterium]|nr:phosphoribosyltransferase domain-containing protein [Blastocatellia bacterium]